MSIDNEKPILPEEENNDAEQQNSNTTNETSPSNLALIVHPSQQFEPKANTETEEQQQTFNQKFKNIFSIEIEDNQEEIMKNFPQQVSFRGEKLWLIVLSTIIACIGLNTDNIFMLVGAMMLAAAILYPILGIGFSLGTNEPALMQKSIRNLLRILGVCIGTSLLYYIISPIQEAGDLLTIHAKPNVYSILTAILAGAIGTLVLAKPQKSYIIPALAILTAIFPPMCSISFGIATGNMDEAFASLYLCFSYSFFMALSAMFTTKMLGYKSNAFAQAEKAKKLKWTLIAIALVTLTPSVVTAYHSVKENIFAKHANLFVQENINFRNTAVIKPIHSKYEKGKRTIEVILVGEPLAEQVIESIQEKLKDPKYRLEDAKLTIRQNVQNMGLPTLSHMPYPQGIQNMSMIEDMFKERDKIIEEQRKRLDEIQKKSAVKPVSFMGTNVSEKSLSKLTAKIGSVYSNVKSIAYTEGFEMDRTSKKSTLINIFVVNSFAPLSLDTREKITELINLEIGLNNMRVVFE